MDEQLKQSALAYHQNPKPGKISVTPTKPLSNQLDLKHPLIRLAGLIEWESFETEFGALYHATLGRPGKPTRLMVGLSYLKHSYNLSDEQVCERWLENPYWQFFCGFDYLQHRRRVASSDRQAPSSKNNSPEIIVLSYIL